MGAGSGMRGRERADGRGGRGDRVNGSQGKVSHGRIQIIFSWFRLQGDSVSARAFETTTQSRLLKSHFTFKLYGILDLYFILMVTVEKELHMDRDILTFNGFFYIYYVKKHLNLNSGSCPVANRLVYFRSCKHQFIKK